MEEEEAAAEESTTVRLKLHILRCRLCHGRLTPPLYEFQFEEGFGACQTCQKTLTPSSSSTPGYIRIHALEKVIESLSIPCPHSANGCNEYVPYLGYSLANHEYHCHYQPRRCFIKDCAFEAPNGALVQHLTAEHRSTIHNFSYEVPLRVSIDPANEPMLVLKPIDDGVHFVLLHSFDNWSGHTSFSVVCCSQSLPSKKMFCKLAARSGQGVLSLNAPVEQWNGLFSTTLFLVVPHSFCLYRNGKLDLEVQLHVED